MKKTLLLHPQTRLQLDSIKPGQAASFIFHGARGSGKATAAYALAQRLNCLGDETGPCLSCRQFDSHNTPDYLVVRPEDKPSVVIEQIRQLIQVLSLSPYRQRSQRVVVIDEAQTMTLEAQSALLKLIEEPPPRTSFMLITQQLEALLPTVRSRCLQIYFAPLPREQISQLLVEQGVVGPTAATLAASAVGAPGIALALATNAEASTSLTHLQTAADQSLRAPTFERLQLAANLTGSKADLSRYGQLVQDRLLANLREGADAEIIANQLASLEQFRKQLAARVAPRVALECLMLELET